MVGIRSSCRRTRCGFEFCPDRSKKTLGKVCDAYGVVALTHRSGPLGAATTPEEHEMTTTYTPEPATYAWSESDRQYGRPYPSPARPEWHDYRPVEHPQYAPVASSANSSMHKGAMVAGLLAAVVGGALLGTFVLGNSTSEPSPSVYMAPESAAPVVAPPPAPAPPAPNTIVVPGRAPAPTVIVPPANRLPAPAAVPAPRPAPRPAQVPPPAPAAGPAPQIRIEGIPIPIPMPAQPPAGQDDNKKGEQQGGQDQDQGGQGQGGQGQGGQGGTDPGQGGQPTGGAGSASAPAGGGIDVTKKKSETTPGDQELTTPLPKDQQMPTFDPDQYMPCIAGIGSC